MRIKTGHCEQQRSFSSSISKIFKETAIDEFGRLGHAGLAIGDVASHLRGTILARNAMPLIPNDIRELVSRNLESLPKRLAIASSVALLSSLCFELGYFLSIDFAFIALLGPADFVKNTLIWSPLAFSIILSLVAHFDAHNAVRKYKSRTGLVSVALFLAIILMLFVFGFIPVQVVLLFPLSLCAWLLALYTILRGDPSPAVTVGSFLAATAISLIMSGAISGKRDLTLYDRPHVLVTIDEKHHLVSLIRILDKGVIAANPIAGVLFYPWNRVGLIRKPDGRAREGAPPPPP